MFLWTRTKSFFFHSSGHKVKIRKLKGESVLWSPWFLFQSVSSLVKHVSFSSVIKAIFSCRCHKNPILKRIIFAHFTPFSPTPSWLFPDDFHGGIRPAYVMFSVFMALSGFSLEIRSSFHSESRQLTPLQSSLYYYSLQRKNQDHLKNFLPFQHAHFHDSSRGADQQHWLPQALLSLASFSASLS